MRLRDTTARRAKLLAGKTEELLFDDEIPGLALRLRASGARSYVFQYRLGQKQRRMTIGSATASDMKNVRKIAKDLYHRVQLGDDPAFEKH
ncbi:MAG TPA: Arm DNA-binding domain-containing protein, partial [Pseudolabrys sp.]|nr:Arm DNA-binding domain-containing protein [Pseudolabrys sp.]